MENLRRFGTKKFGPVAVETKNNNKRNVVVQCAWNVCSNTSNMNQLSSVGNGNYSGGMIFIEDYHELFFI